MRSLKVVSIVILTVIFLPVAEVLAEKVVKVGPNGGEVCVDPMPPEVGYRPSLFECNGNAAILFRGVFRSAYSVVLRRNGEKNDRDRFNPGCALASCSPLKVQKKIELPDQEINCLGDTGYGTEIALANRISIKFFAKITNPNDPSQFRQYCLLNSKAEIN